MKILISLSNMDNAKLLGFGRKVYYHGGFSHFDEFDPKRSGSGTFNFASDKKFAERYAQTRSQDEQGDYDIVVRAFYLPKNLFDYKNKNHIRKLAAILPDKLKVSSSYGWAAWGGPRELTKQQVLDEIQGIAVPYTGLDEETKKAIRDGATRYKRDGGIESVISYDKNTDTVEYAPSYQMDTINGLKNQIAMFERDQPGHFQIGLWKLELQRKLNALKTYKLKLSPGRKKGYDNWQILESEAIRPYLKKLGFLGALMQESKHETACVFDAKHIRLVDAKFDLHNKNSGKLHASSEKSNLLKWFGDSKIVDKQGNPLKVYHGTRHDFEVFTRKYSGMNTRNMPSSFLGFFFTDNKGEALEYTDGKGKVLDVYLKIKNPKIMTKRDFDYFNFVGVYGDDTFSKQDMLQILKEEFLDYGYDGIIITGVDDGNHKKRNYYVAFDSNQIKSVKNTDYSDHESIYR